MRGNGLRERNRTRVRQQNHKRNQASTGKRMGKMMEQAKGAVQKRKEQADRKRAVGGGAVPP